MFCPKPRQILLKMPDKTKQQRDQERINKIVELSKQWGVPTNAIFTKVKSQPTDIWTNPQDALPEYREYFTFGSDGKVAKSITDRYETRVQGYSGSTFNKQPNVAPQPVPTVAGNTLTDIVPTYEQGGSLNFSSKPAYQRWLGYVHAKGLAESTPGNQKISINGNSHRVKHAYGGPIDSNIQGYNPYAVSSELQNDTPYLPYKPVGSPLNQATANVNNYFATEQSNMIPNDASLEGPAFDRPEYLLDAPDDTVHRSGYDPAPEDKKPKSISKGSKFKMPNMRFNTAGPILALAGLTGQMAQQKNFNDNQARRINRQFNQENYNAAPYGRGSQAIYKNGGKMANGGYMLGETYNLTDSELAVLNEQGYSFDIIS